MRQPRSQYRFETSLMRKFSDWMPHGKTTSFGQGFFLHAGAQRGMGHSTLQGIGIRRFLSMHHLDSPPLRLLDAFAEVERGSAASKLCLFFPFSLFSSFFPICFFELAAFHFPLSGMGYVKHQIGCRENAKSGLGFPHQRLPRSSCHR